MLARQHARAGLPAFAAPDPAHPCCCACPRVAVYRDEATGELHKFSGLCPHLGCLLQWCAAACLHQAAQPRWLCCLHLWLLLT